MARTKREANYRKKIIMAAAAMIKQDGIEQTSLLDISHRLDISPGTLYYYFPNKDELIFEICTDHLNKINDRVLRVVQQVAQVRDPYRIFEAVLQFFVDNTKRIAESHIYLLQVAILKNKQLREKYHIVYKERIVKMEEGISEVLGKGINHSALSQTIVALIDGLLIQHLLGDENPNYQKLVKLFSVKQSAKTAI